MNATPQKPVMVSHTNYKSFDFVSCCETVDGLSEVTDGKVLNMFSIRKTGQRRKPITHKYGTITPHPHSIPHFTVRSE